MGCPAKMLASSPSDTGRKKYGAIAGSMYQAKKKKCSIRFCLHHPPRQHHARHHPRQSGQQRPRQGMAGLRHLRRKEIDAHGVENCLRYYVNRGKLFCFHFLLVLLYNRKRHNLISFVKWWCGLFLTFLKAFIDI